MDVYQQFIVHVVDERGDPVHDFNVQLFLGDGNPGTSAVEGFDVDVHAYSTDPSYRCFHVNLSELSPEKIDPKRQQLWMRLRASAGNEIVEYQGYGAGSENEAIDLNLTSRRV